MDSKVPHVAIVGFNIHIHEKLEDASLSAQPKFRKGLTFTVESDSEEGCVDGLAELIKETKDLWMKNINKK